MKRTQSQAGIRKPSTKAKAQFKRPRPALTMARQIGATAGNNVAPEKKNIDVSGTCASAAANTWSNLLFLNPIVQGTAIGQRVGRKVILKSLLVRWQATQGAVGSYRIMVVYDHSPNGALPVIGDILLNAGALGQNASNNLANNDRFLILRDFYPRSTITDGQNGQSDSFFVRFPDGGLQNVWTDAITGAIADCTTGAIYIMAVSWAGTNNVILTSRIRYTDV